MSEILLLVSNCNKEVYGNVNKANHFFVDLPQEYHLSGNWSVGLRELVYSNDISTIVNEKFIVITKTIVSERFYEEFSKNKKKLQHKRVIYKNDVWYFKYKMSNPLPNNPDVKYVLTAFYKYDEEDHKFLNIDGVKKGNNIEFEMELNIETDEDLFYMDILFDVGVHYTEKSLYIKTKKFNNTQTLLDEINDLCKKWDIRFKFEDDLLVLSDLPPFLEIDVSELKFILGFKDSILRKPNIKATYPMSLNRGIFSFFIYLNICKHIMTGDTMVPLLRSVNIGSNELKGIVTRTLDNPVFIPISYTSFKTLEIQICDDKGELVPFGNDVNTQLLIELKKL